MKRLLVVLFACSLFAALAVPQALAAEHNEVGPHVRQGSSAAALARFTPSGALAPAATRSVAYGGGTNILTAVELPYYLTPSTVPSGSVDSVSHPDDVYWFFLEKGATVQFGLALATPGSQLALNIYSPTATDLSDSPVLSDMDYSHAFADVYTAPIGGFYCVDIHAVTGASAYTLDYGWGSPNDNIPGVKPSGSTIYSAFQFDWNWSDVVKFPLKKGDKLTLNLAPIASSLNSPDFDVDLYVYRPSAATVYPHASSNANIVAHSFNDAPAAEKLTYKAPSTGNYYVNMYNYKGDGTSALKWSVNPVRPSIKRTPSASKLTFYRVSGVAKFSLGARFTDQFGLPIKSAKVYLQTSTNGKTWKSTYKGTTNGDGYDQWNFTVKKKGSGYFRWYRAASSTSKSATTTAQKVTIK